MHISHAFKELSAEACHIIAIVFAVIADPIDKVATGTVSEPYERMASVGTALTKCFHLQYREPRN